MELRKTTFEERMSDNCHWTLQPKADQKGVDYGEGRKLGEREAEEGAMASRRLGRASSCAPTLCWGYGQR